MLKVFKKLKEELSGKERNLDVPVMYLYVQRGGEEPGS
jgi:hypothetical protein